MTMPMMKIGVVRVAVYHVNVPVNEPSHPTRSGIQPQCTYFSPVSPSA
jgi:hypothetical protein